MKVKRILILNYSKDFITVDTRCMWDKEISLEAKALYCMLLSQHDKDFEEIIKFYDLNAEDAIKWAKELAAKNFIEIEA